MFRHPCAICRELLMSLWVTWRQKWLCYLSCTVNVGALCALVVVVLCGMLSGWGHSCMHSAGQHNTRNYNNQCTQGTNIYSTWLQHNHFCLSSNTEGYRTLPEDGTWMPKHVGAWVINKGVIISAQCWSMILNQTMHGTNIKLKQSLFRSWWSIRYSLNSPAWWSSNACCCWSFFLYGKSSWFKDVKRTRGGAVGWSRGFDFRWCHLNFSLTFFRPHYCPGVDSASKQKW
jgi:hypothetical protein